MQITIFSTTTCATCHLVTNWLDKQEIDYVKKDTDEDSVAMAEFMDINDGLLGVPFTVIKAEDGTMTKILGFDQNKFKTALSLA